MFRIGDFSRIARVSCRLLRYYDELGLLKPARVEPETGYRYYSAAQLPKLNRILVLRDLGLSLEQIAQALRDDLPAGELRGMLLMRRAEAEQAVEAESQRLRQIESRIAQIEAEGQPMADDVVLRDEPARRLLSLRQKVASFAEGARLLVELAAIVPRQAGEGALDQLVAIAHAAEFEPDSIDAEFGFFLRPGKGEALRLPDGRALTVRDVPPVERLAACVRIGPPQEAHLTTARIGRFIESNGYRICGPNREVFLQRPVAGQMEKAVVEMQFPVEKASRK
ncbi:MAG TPA: MerR family transcriptional regulator [Burkholderiales bacterium]|nr:MerR family transcriptional regulator [Burkholderiales bacterium]